MHVNVPGYVCEEHDNPADFFLDSILQNQAEIADSSNGTEDTGKMHEVKKKRKKNDDGCEDLLSANDMHLHINHICQYVSIHIF